MGGEPAEHRKSASDVIKERVTYHRESLSIANLLIRDAYIIANNREMGMYSVDPERCSDASSGRASVLAFLVSQAHIALHDQDRLPKCLKE